MLSIQVRDIVNLDDFVGDNTSDVVVNGVHFNRTALDLYNYTLYANNTISNASKCYLIFDNFKPHMFSNGSWINATTCYIPYYGVGARGHASIAFAVAFGLSILFTLINLRKHGKLYLREDRRFRVVGRRWQWYWMLFVAACALISTIAGIDVDRYYLQQIPIILQSFFYMLMVPGTLAMVWECTRHWGSWQERQVVDRDVYGLPPDDRRAKTEFWLPLVFYLFAWMNFFMTIPRSWTPLQKQHTLEQQQSIARPAATGPREKAGAVFAIAAFFVICFSLDHSLKHYKSRAVGFGMSKYFRDCPLKISLALILLAVRLAYGVASAWFWDLSLFKEDVAVVWPFALGYGPILLILIIFEVAGLLEENEDRVLIKQRRARGQLHDQELNIVHKPSWWSRNWVAQYQTDEQRLRGMPVETGGGRPTQRQVGPNIELGNMNMRNRSRNRARDNTFRDGSPDSINNGQEARGGGPGVTRADGHDVDSIRTDMTGHTLTAENAGAVQPPRVRSMLDV